MSIDDDLKPAREAKAVWDIALEAMLAGYNWSFAMGRDSLSADVAAPAHIYALQYQLPSDSLRLVYLADRYVGADLTDYRTAPMPEFQIEGQKILTNIGAPLLIRYVKRITDTGLMPPPFVSCFGARLATLLAESLTQSSTKRQDAEVEFRKAISIAIRANAIEMPPEKLADDEWVLSRL